jgi:hypothetical protein
VQDDPRFTQDFMTGEDAAFPKFLDAIKPFRDLWPSIEISHIAVLRNDKWLNVAACLRLKPYAPSKSHSLEDIILDDFCAVRRTVDSNDLETILEGVRHKMVRIGNREIHWDSPPSRPDAPQSSRPEYHWSFYDLPEGQPRGWTVSSPDTRKYQIDCIGPELGSFWTNDEWTRLEDRLKDHDPPVGGIQDLVDNLLGYQFGFTKWQSMATAAIIAPFYSGLQSGIEVRPDSIIARGFAPSSADPRDFSLGVVAAGSDSVHRRRVDLTAKPDSVDPTKLVLEAEVPISEGLTLDAFLLFRGVQVGRIQGPIGSENPRVLSHLALDPQLERIQKALDQSHSSSDARSFEVGTAWLFHLCGFQTVNYGLVDLKPDDEIDVLAFAPNSRQLLAIEVTLRSPLNKDKLAKLRRKIDDLSRSILNYDIVGGVVSASSTQYDAEVADARSLGLIVLYRADLDELLEAAVKNRSVRDTYESLKQRLTRR